jgi:leader peptidase (prepilin peptidase)/N-methyltransferase
VGLIGAAVGSFLNVIAYRLPRRLSPVRPRSACPQCGTPVAPYDNIPILSYLLLGGRCRQCRSPIGRRYPLTEAATAALSMLVALQLGPSPGLVPALIATWLLLALTRIDLDCFLLPDTLTLTLAGVGAVAALAGWGPGPLSALAGGLLGWGSLFGVGWLYARLTGREGLGGGDPKLLGALGVWLGADGVLLCLFLAAVGGSLIGGLIVILQRGGRHYALPFGPFLAGAGWVMLLWKEPVLQWYLAFSLGSA